VLGVADHEVLEVDERDRPLRVKFTGMPSAASLEYTMGYRYDEPGRRLHWSTVGETDRAIDGEAWIETLEPGRCRLHYTLTARASRSLPAWARDTLADDTPEKVVKAFQRFAERRATPYVR
jgi:hypothetical protein